MASKRRPSVFGSVTAAPVETLEEAVNALAANPIPMDWDRCEFTLFNHMRPSIKNPKHYDKVLHFTVPKDTERDHPNAGI